MAAKVERKCDFCSKSSKQVGSLVEGGDSKKVYICGDCLQIANSVMSKKIQKSDSFELTIQSPKEIVKKLDLRSR